MVQRPIIDPNIYWTWSLAWRRSEVRPAVLATIDALTEGDTDGGIHAADAWLPATDPHRS